MTGKLTLQARWVLPVASPPIENARVCVETGKIVAVERGRGGAHPDVDYGDAVILPGFVNAHTHLELTSLHRKVPPGPSLADWITRLAPQHPRRGDEAAWRESIRGGLRQSLVAGVTAIADIGQGRVAIDEWAAAPLHVVGFLEVLGIGPKRLSGYEEQFGLCESQPALRTSAAPGLSRLGVSPHAPYSTDVHVYQAAVEYAFRAGRPMTTHLAETREELQFLRDGSGPFRELLEKFGLWDGSFRPLGCSPVEYAERMGLFAATRGSGESELAPLLAHCNYVSDSDLERLARCDVSVAFCPRAHAFFGHEPHRYVDMLARGINVCLGTDSLASNETLSILDEIRFLRRNDSPVSDEMLLRMATVNGARALGLEGALGSLGPGLAADLIVLPLANASAREPLEDLFGSDGKPLAVYVAGSRV